MTQELYDKVTRIYDRLSQLAKVKKEISPIGENRLSYIHKSKPYNNLTPEPCNEFIIRYIYEILDRHDKMIRAEIDEEIEKLEKEIESL